MIIKEGRCPNCGSILQLDSQSEKGHCLFCDAVFNNAEAFEAAENLGGRVFPNLPQPKYGGPSLDPRGNTAMSGFKTTEVAKKKTKPAPQPVYVHKEPVKLPEIKLSKKMRIRVAAVSVILIALVAGITIPLVTRRDSDRAKLVNQFGDLLPFEAQADEVIAIRHITNDYVLLAAPEAVSAEDAVGLFRSYCDTRAAIRGELGKSFKTIYGQVTMRLVTPEGSYLIDEPSSDEVLTDGTAVELLP